jgi:hypothetical protein
LRAAAALICACDPPRRDAQNLRAVGKVGEGGIIRAGHPDLAADRRELVEQGGAALRIEMRGDLIEQHDRRDAARGCNKMRVGQHEAG